jgi:hypothetical protein
MPLKEDKPLPPPLLFVVLPLLPPDCDDVDDANDDDGGGASLLLLSFVSARLYGANADDCVDDGDVTIDDAAPVDEPPYYE